MRSEIGLSTPEQRRKRLERKRLQDTERAAARARAKSKTKKKKKSKGNKGTNAKKKKGGAPEARLLDQGLVRVVEPKNPAWIGSGRRTSLFGKPNLVVQQNRRGTTVHQSQRGAVFNER